MQLDWHKLFVWVLWRTLLIELVVAAIVSGIQSLTPSAQGSDAFLGTMLLLLEVGSLTAYIAAIILGIVFLQKSKYPLRQYLEVSIFLSILAIPLFGFVVFLTPFSFITASGIVVLAAPKKAKA